MFFLKYKGMMKYIFKPSNVRFASKTNKYRPYKSIEENSIIRATLDQNKPLSQGEWNELRHKLLSSKSRNITEFNIDAFILDSCLPSQLDVGKSYIRYLKQSGIEPTTAALLKLLGLYYAANRTGTQIGSSDQQNIIDIHDQLLRKFPVLGSSFGERLVQGLVLTKEWRKSLRLRKFCTPPSDVLNCITIRAIQEEDESLTWKLMHELVTEYTVLRNDVFTSYIGFCEKNPQLFTENINKMLTFIQDNEILVTNQVANEFQRAFQNLGYKCATTSITKEGECHECHKFLRDVQVTEEEFNQLSIQILNKVLIGRNIFFNSTQEEMESFIASIDKTKPFDCVIDGLNVAYSIQKLEKPISKVSLLANVVRHFVDQKKSVLVIGRKYMNDWPEAEMDYIRKNTNLFLTDDSSKDDPFFLYASLKSGPRTDFVTRDLLRDHTIKLDKHVKIIFRRWQQQHQYKVHMVDGRATFVKLIQFDPTAQQVDGCWHIPYNNDLHCYIARQSFDLRWNWLCVSKILN